MAKMQWKQAEPWTVRVGSRVRVMLPGRASNGRYRFTVAKVTRLLKGGFGVEAKLPNGSVVTRDTQDVAISWTTQRGRRRRRAK